MRGAIQGNFYLTYKVVAKEFNLELNGYNTATKKFKFECPFFYQYIYRVFNPLKTSELKGLREESSNNQKKQI